MKPRRSSRVLLPLLLAVFPVVLLGQNAAGGAPPASSTAVAEAPVNPQFVRYMNALSGPALGATRTTGSGHGLGWIPSPLDLSHLRSQPRALEGGPLPSSYDLRTLGKVTAVRNQGSCGSCWAFGTFGSMESVLLPAGTFDFSENNLKNLSGFDYGPCDGGNGDISTAYLARWGGPVNESDDPYVASATMNSPPGLAAQKHVQDVLMLARRSSPLDNDALKNAVMTYGGVMTHMWWDDVAYKAATNAYYYAAADPDPNAAHAGGHAVTLVGWDDSYSKNNFATAPTGDGAFLIKNSWGSAWGQGGYFWLSYYDTQYAIGAESFVFVGNESATNYNRRYEYDPLGWVSSLGYHSTTAWFANVFTAESTEQLHAVAFYVGANASPYTVTLYTDVTGGPTTGTLATTASGTLDAGYHTVVLTAPVALTQEQKFSVVVNLTTPGYNYPIPLEYAYPGYSMRAMASAGQSFFSPDGTAWTDATQWRATANVALKAFAQGDAAVNVTVNTNPSGRSFTLNGALYNAPQTFLWAPAYSHTLATTTPQDSGAARYTFTSWSDGGELSHTVSPAVDTTFTATFTPQYQLSMAVSPAGAGTITAAPASADGFYGANANVQITAAANTGYAFAGFSGDVVGSTNPQMLTMSAPHAVTANFTDWVPPDFGVAAGTQSPSPVRAGNSASYTLTVTPAGGFSQAVSFSCSGLPALAACTFTPAMVTPSGAPATTTLAISTVAPLVCSATNLQQPRAVYALWLPILGVVLGGAGWRRKRRLLLLALGVGLGLLLLAPGCGSSGTPCTSRSGTPAGTYSLTVTASAGTLQHTTAITLNVQ